MIDIRIPPLGMSTVEVDILECRVKKGDTVTMGSVLIVVETEKAVLEIESEEDGTIVELMVEPGQKAKVGDIICRIQENT